MRACIGRDLRLLKVVDLPLGRNGWRPSRPATGATRGRLVAAMRMDLHPRRRRLRIHYEHT